MHDSTCLCLGVQDLAFPKRMKLDSGLPQKAVQQSSISLDVGTCVISTVEVDLR